MVFDNIILIGFMGSGKTSIGKRLARHLKYEYIDTDQLVTVQTGLSISELVEQQGEPAFRKWESVVLENLLQKEKILLATGGGIIIDPKNQEILRRLGTIVWLHASADMLFERAQRNSYRPLLEVEHPRRTFNYLFSERLPIYESLSDLKIDTTTLSYSQTLQAIVKALSEISCRLPAVSNFSSIG